MRIQLERDGRQVKRQLLRGRTRLEPQTSTMLIPLI
jgi:hypothetical protein